MKYIKTNQSSQMITITGVKLISYTVIKDNQEPVRLKLHIGDIVDLNEESEGNELFRSITCGLYNIGDDCFWIIGRVGLQALKCVNDLFDTVTNSVLTSDYWILYEFLNNLENNIKKIFFNFFFQKHNIFDI
ncbi:unnamed protein product [Rhizophagus irregularis]|nr:unnamed protein product [Rhizophagus irregularis]